MNTFSVFLIAPVEGWTEKQRDSSNNNELAAMGMQKTKIRNKKDQEIIKIKHQPPTNKLCQSTADLYLIQLNFYLHIACVLKLQYSGSYFAGEQSTPSGLRD